MAVSRRKFKTTDTRRSTHNHTSDGNTGLFLRRWFPEQLPQNAADADYKDSLKGSDGTVCLQLATTVAGFALALTTGSLL